MLTKNTNILVAIQPHRGPVQVWLTTPAEVIYDAIQDGSAPLALYDRNDYALLQEEMKARHADDSDTPPGWLAETLDHFNHLADAEGNLPPEITGPVVMVEPKCNDHVTFNPSVEQQLAAALDVLNDWQHVAYAHDQATFYHLLDLYPEVRGKGWYVGADEPE